MPSYLKHGLGTHVSKPSTATKLTVRLQVGSRAGKELRVVEAGDWAHLM